MEKFFMTQRMQILMNMSCLRMRGLPYSASEKDIMDFMSIHADFVVGSVHIIYNVQGRPSGEAFVEMQSPNAAEQCAKKLHLKHMGERYIEVFQCNVQDMMWMLAKSHVDQFAAEQLNQMNNKGNNKKHLNTNNNNTYINPPSPPLIITKCIPQIPTPISTIAPQPITTNGFIPQPVTSIPVCTTSPYIPVLSPMATIPTCYYSPGYIPQPCPQPQQQITGPACVPQLIPQQMIGQAPSSPDMIQVQVNKFVNMGDVTYVPYYCGDVQRQCCVATQNCCVATQTTHEINCA